MKTLDEVIKAFDICKNGTCKDCPSAVMLSPNDYRCSEEHIADALHYLKEYQDSKEMLRNWTEKAISEQQNLSDAITFMRAYRDDKDDLTALRAYWKEQHENNALTWDELKSMEGKPVWVEEKYSFSEEWHGRWEVINSINDTEFWDEDEKNIGMTDEESKYKSSYGKTWQAYRKERQ